MATALEQKFTDAALAINAALADVTCAVTKCQNFLIFGTHEQIEQRRDDLSQRLEAYLNTIETSYLAIRHENERNTRK